MINLNPSRAAFDAIATFTAGLPPFVPAPMIRMSGGKGCVEAWWRHAGMSQVFTQDGVPYADPVDMADRLVTHYRPPALEAPVYLSDTQVDAVRTLLGQKNGGGVFVHLHPNSDYVRRFLLVEDRE